MTSSIRVPDTITKLSPDDTYPVVNGADVSGFTDLQKEVNSNTSKIETNIQNILNLAKKGKTKVINNVGDSTPDWDNEPHGNYLLVQRAQTKTITVETPDPTGGVLDGAILTIYNESPTQALRLIPNMNSSDSVNSASAINVPNENFISLVYELKDTNWLTLESGYIPAARINIANYVENKLNTDGKLHTEAELETAGFLKGIQVSSTGGSGNNVNGAKWIHFTGATVLQGKTGQAEVHITGGSVDPTESVLHFQTIAARDQWSAAEGSKYTQVVCVVDRDDNGYTAWYEWDSSKWVNHNAAGIILSDSDGAIPKHIKTVVLGPGFAVQQAGDQEDAALVTYSGSGSGSGSITLDDGTTNVAGINTLEMKGMKVTRLPTDPGGSAGNAQITSGINWHMMKPNQQYGSALANEVVIVPPLNTYIDPNQTGAEAVRLELTPGTFEPLHSPSFLAYLKDSEDVVGRLPQGLEEDEGARHKGALWFEDVVVPAGAYIAEDKPNKSYGIQEADSLDPNVSGGMNYLIAFRIHMRGKAPSDGFVRAYLYNHQVNPFQPKGYLLDVNGEPMMTQRAYKAGEELGSLTVLGVVNAKGLQYFTCQVEDNMSGDLIELTDRTEGCTGLMIQALKSDDKTGRGLIQFEQDTNQNIEFSSHYLGVERMTLSYATSRPDPVVSYVAGNNFTVVDGTEMINRSGIKLGTVDNRLVIQDDGVHMADFNFGKVFTAEETQMLRGKTIQVLTKTTTKQSASRIYAMKWIGKPDEYTKGIISSWNNMNPVFETNWVSFGNNEIVENVLEEDVGTSMEFVVPADANNYAIIVTTSSGPIQPYHLEMKQFDVNVKEPFIGFSLDAPELHNEQHFAFDPRIKEFTQNTQGYASLRYTIGDSVEGLPMPVGIIGKGLADINLDTTINQVSGSQARGGEGAIQFQADGRAHISNMFNLWNETATKSTVKFWWVEFDPDGTANKLADSEFTVEVPAHAKNFQTRMVYAHDFEAGARIGLRASADKADGAFLQCVDDSKPLNHTIVNFDEIKAVDGGDDPWGSLDLSQFEHVYEHELDGRLVVHNASGVTIPFVIEDNMYFDVKRAIKIEGGIARPVRRLDYSYNYATHELKVSFGETVEEGRVLIGIYL